MRAPSHRSLTLACALSLASGCRRASAPAPVIAPTRRFTDLTDRAAEATIVARRCEPCHRAQFEAWSASQHAHAQRAIDPPRDAPSVESLPESLRSAGRQAVGVIGVAPLTQRLVPMGEGRVQVLDPAWDPQQSTWFSIFGDERRAPTDWGHWTGRGMNWNAQCAFCHTTVFDKGYSPALDRYQSSWRAVGIACTQCHDPPDGHHVRSPDAPWRVRAVDGCASCHARREALDAGFRAGERFDDHFRLTLADTRGGWHANGQVAEEDFEFSSLAMSRMGQRGVTCLDCHDPHSGGLRAPIDRDQLCLTCHGSPSARGAPSIAATHSHHPAESAGARCVHCHMPAATFMARDRRRDHGFTRPDPTLAAAIGAPDACEGCHADRGRPWIVAAFERWYGDTPRVARTRARLVIRARGADPTVGRELAEAALHETNDAWRASLVALLGPWTPDPAVHAALEHTRDDASPWVRAATVRALAEGGDGRAVFRLRRDPVRAVRMEAAWATREGLRDDPALRAELQRWMDESSDQPGGAVRQAELAETEGRDEDALAWATRATQWEPSGQTYFARALVLAARGRVPEAAEDLGRAVALDPGFGRAHYNLGLAQAQLGRRAEALASLTRAEALLPDDLEVTWATATVMLSTAERDGACARARRVLAAQPEHPGAQTLAAQACGRGR